MSRAPITTGFEMTKTILALFNLKDGASSQDYITWAKSVDLPTVNGLKSVDQFTAFNVEGLLGSEERPPYQYFETIDVNDMDLFMSEVGSDVMQKVAAEFRQFTDDVIFLVSESL